MDKEKRTLQQNFKVLESLLLAKRELLKNQGVSFAELDSLICVEAELLVNGFNEVIHEKYDKKTVDEKTAEKKSEMPCNCQRDSREKLALMEMRNAFMKGKKYLLIPLDN